MVLTGLAAVLCALAFPIWVLGVPGIENEYARGWLMGLQVIIAYPVCWIIVFAVSRISGRRKRTDGETKTRVTHVPAILMLVLCITAAVRLWIAVRVMADQP